MEIIFNNRHYNMTKTDNFFFDDIVSINGYVGWVDCIGTDTVILIDANNNSVHINVKDINEVYMLSKLNMRAMLPEGAFSFNWKEQKRAS